MKKTNKQTKRQAALCFDVSSGAGGGAPEFQSGSNDHADQRSWPLPSASDVLLLGEGVGRHPRGRGRGQALR